jgi:hypothetical protein
MLWRSEVILGKASVKLVTLCKRSAVPEILRNIQIAEPDISGMTRRVLLTGANISKYLFGALFRA